MTKNILSWHLSADYLSNRNCPMTKDLFCLIFEWLHKHCCKINIESFPQHECHYNHHTLKGVKYHKLTVVITDTKMMFWFYGGWWRLSTVWDCDHHHVEHQSSLQWAQVHSREDPVCDCGGGSAVTGTTTAVYCCTVPLAYCYHTHSVTHSLRTISGIRCTLYVISMLYVMITNFDSIWVENMHLGNCSCMHFTVAQYKPSHINIILSSLLIRVQNVWCLSI